MYKYLPFLLILLIWAGCITVEYEKPQPDGTRTLKKFPKKLQGSYLVDEEGMLLIRKYSFVAGHKDSINYGDVTYLDNDNILRKFNNVYVFNSRDDEYWESRIIRMDKDSLFILEIDAQDENTLNKLGEIIDVQVLKNSKGEVDKYLINPTRDEFIMLIEQGAFKPLISLKRLD